MAESDWARNMRREAEKQTIFASDQAHYAAEAATAQHEAARNASYAAAAAARSEENSELLLEEQRRLSKQNSAHNFAMWRQATLNGESYDRWLMEASPLVNEFANRWGQWTAAKEADIASVSAAKEAESLSRFSVNASAAAKFDGPYTDGPWRASWWRILTVYLVISATITGIWLVTLVGGIFNHSWWDFGGSAASLIPTVFFLSIAYGAFDFLVLARRAQRNLKARDDAKAWQKAEVDAFASSLPRNWKRDEDTAAWNQMVAAQETVESMPQNYVEFTPQMLTDVDLGLPSPRSSSSLPPEATRTRDLLDTWAAKSVPPSPSTV